MGPLSVNCMDAGIFYGDNPWKIKLLAIMMFFMASTLGWFSFEQKTPCCHLFDKKCPYLFLFEV